MAVGYCVVPPPSIDSTPYVGWRLAARASGYRYDVIDWPSISRLPSWLPSRSLSSHIHRSDSLSQSRFLSPRLFGCRLPPLFTLRSSVHYTGSHSHSSHAAVLQPNSLSSSHCLLAGAYGHTGAEQSRTA